MHFNVPSMYFYTNQSVMGPQGIKLFDRSIAVTFHKRNDTDQSNDQSGACYTSRANFKHCPSVQQTWRHEDSTDAGSNSCTQKLVGKLDFFDLLYNDQADPSTIIVRNDTNRVINGFNTSTWDLYLTAKIETWTGFIQVGDHAGSNYPNGGHNFNNPDSV